MAPRRMGQSLTQAMHCLESTTSFNPVPDSSSRGRTSRTFTSALGKALDFGHVLPLNLLLQVIHKQEDTERASAAFPPLPDWEVLDEELQDHKFDLGKIAASLWRYYSDYGQYLTEGSILSIRFEDNEWGRLSIQTDPHPPATPPPPPLPLQPLGLSPITCIDIQPMESTSEVLGFSTIDITETRKRKGKAASAQTPYALKRRLDDAEARKIATAPPVGNPAADSTPASTTAATPSAPRPTPAPRPPRRNPKPLKPQKPDPRHTHPTSVPPLPKKASKDYGDQMAEKQDDIEGGREKDKFGSCIPGGHNGSRQGETRRKMVERLPVRVRQRTEIGKGRPPASAWIIHP
ncbi:hypothetical protein BDZ91DRAFT_791901 [Kalaharituber pfeilii]|nr:hypothetical protein BDZ91DRAFT_791901 [Kalaharituber pfeilii]